MLSCFPCLLRRQSTLEALIRVGSRDEVLSSGDVTKTNLQSRPGKERYSIRVVENTDSKERSGHKIVTLPAKRVNMTTPRLHQSTTWVYASPLRISGATKHGGKKDSCIYKRLHNRKKDGTKILKHCLHLIEFHIVFLGRIASNDVKTTQIFRTDNVLPLTEFW